MTIKFVDIARQNTKLKTQLLSVIEKIINDAIFIDGKNVSEFEELFAQYCGKKYAIGLNSGTDALKLALLAYGILPGDEVITVPNSYFSTAMVISDIGAVPVFVDVDPLTHTMDIAQLAGKISAKTKAIIPVHLYGQPAEIAKVYELAEKNNIVVLEDVCQSHGAMYAGKRLPYGETGAFSFYPSKNLGCFGDGGILVTDNKKIYEVVKQLRNDGTVSKYIHKRIGIKSRLDEIQAAILKVKLSHLDEWNRLRRAHAQVYTTSLTGIPGLTLPTEQKNSTHVYHLYVIETEKRDQLQEYLREKGIETGIHYPLPIHLQEAYVGEGYKSGDFPITEEKAGKILSLPMFPELTKEEIEYTCTAIKEFFASV